MAKFKVGDRARIVEGDSDFIHKECIIVAIGPFRSTYENQEYIFDYHICVEDCIGFGAMECQLEPIIDLGNWNQIEDSIGWNPTKVTYNAES